MGMSPVILASVLLPGGCSSENESATVKGDGQVITSGNVSTPTLQQSLDLIVMLINDGSTGLALK